MQHYTAVLSKLVVCLFLSIPLLAGCVGESGVSTKVPVVGDEVDLLELEKKGQLIIAFGFSPEEIPIHPGSAKQGLQVTANGLNKDVGGLKPYHFLLLGISLEEFASETIAETMSEIVCKPSKGKQASDVIVKLGSTKYKDPSTSIDLVVFGLVIDMRFSDCTGKDDGSQLKPSEKPPSNSDGSTWA